ncbi:hypothetical protein AAC387_Pa05g0866 [Persea americana]
MQQPSISLTLSLCHRFSKQPFISLALSFSLTPSLSADPSSLIHPLSQSRTEIPLHLKTPKSPTLTLVSLEAKESTPSSPQDFNPRSYQIEVYKAALMRNTIAVLETGGGKDYDRGNADEGNRAINEGEWYKGVAYLLGSSSQPCQSAI